jgi:hypothetical protein
MRLLKILNEGERAVVIRDAVNGCVITVDQSDDDITFEYREAMRNGQRRS